MHKQSSDIFKLVKLHLDVTDPYGVEALRNVLCSEEK